MCQEYVQCRCCWQRPTEGRLSAGPGQSAPRGAGRWGADDGVCDLIQLENLAGEGKRSVKRPWRQDEDKPGRLK
jgi:hypothetical protein